MSEFNNECNIFKKIDEIYEKPDFHTDENILEILNEHLNIEKTLAKETESQFKGTQSQIHEDNIKTIQFLIDNIHNSLYISDAVLYLYSFMIYRYTLDATSYFNIPSETIHKYKELSSKWKAFYYDIDRATTGLIQFFLTYIYDNGRLMLDYIINSDANHSNYVYNFCRILLYNKQFCTSQYIYNEKLHYNFYILFDTLTHKLSYKDNEAKIKWIDAFIGYSEKNKKLTVDSIPNYYSTYAKLYKCICLSNSADNKEQTNKDLALVELPEFEINDTCHQVYYLYALKLLCLDNINDNIGMLDLCNYLLGILEYSDNQSLKYMEESINWRKNNALRILNPTEHENWFFTLICNTKMEQIKNYVYFSPFIKNESERQNDINLYHYTDISALMSIIENKKLRFTRYDFLNDMEEIKYIVKVIGNHLPTLQNDSLKNFITGCLEILKFYFDEESEFEKIETEKEIILRSIKDSLSNIYILSNSTKDDNLSLWHYYSGGTGCSIKISKNNSFIEQAKALNRSIDDRNAHIFMRKIEYVENIPGPELFNLLEIISTHEQLNNKQKEYLACVHIVYEGIFTKNKNISQEEEFRIAVLLSESTEYIRDPLITHHRVGKNTTIVPYIELNIEPNWLIEEIRIAPLNKTDIAKKGLQEYLKSKGFKNYNGMVKISDINLRY